jgi:hypothetical protein
LPAYRPSTPPPGDADFGPTIDQITADLLALIHNFFTHASRHTTREELRRYLAAVYEKGRRWSTWFFFHGRPASSTAATLRSRADAMG